MMWRRLVFMALVLALLFVVPRVLFDQIDESRDPLLTWLCGIFLVLVVALLLLSVFSRSMQTEVKVQIDRPITGVFDFVAARYFQNVHQWSASPDPSLRRTLQQTSPGPIAAGSTAVELVTTNAGHWQWNYKVLEFIPDSHLALECTNSQSNAKLEFSYDFSPAGAATELSLKVRLSVNKGFSFIPPFYKGTWRKGYDDSMRRLKAVVEADVPA